MNWSVVISPSMTLFSALTMGWSSPIDVVVNLFAIGFAAVGCATGSFSMFGFVGTAFVPLCCVGGLMLAMAWVADLVTRAMLDGGLGCVWPSVAPLMGGFGVL